MTYHIQVKGKRLPAAHPLVCHAEKGVFLLCEGPVTYRLRWYHRLLLELGLVTEVELERWFRGPSA